MSGVNYNWGEFTTATAVTDGNYYTFDFEWRAPSPPSIETQCPGCGMPWILYPASQVTCCCGRKARCVSGDYSYTITWSGSKYKWRKL